jgi:histidine kinase
MNTQLFVVSITIIDNIVKFLNLEAQDRRLVIVFEDFGGISLKRYLECVQPSITLTTKIALTITKALIYIHEQNLIHKDIKPANIIINPDTEEIKLTDFSITSRLSKKFL